MENANKGFKLRAWEKQYLQFTQRNRPIKSIQLVKMLSIHLEQSVYAVNNIIRKTQTFSNMDVMYTLLK